MDTKVGTKIDISSFTKSELLELNKLIIKRIKYLNNLDSLESLSSLNKGDIVSFEHGNRYVMGVIMKINIKTASVLTENGEIWRVDPALLKKPITSN